MDLLLGKIFFSESTDVVTYNNTNNKNWGGMEYRNGVINVVCRSTLFKKIAEEIDTNGNPTQLHCDPTPPIILTFWKRTNIAGQEEVMLKQSYLRFGTLLTPLYLGKAQTDQDGNFMFNDAMLTSDAADIQGNQLTTADWVNQRVNGYVTANDFTAAGVTIISNFGKLVEECNKLRQDVAALSGLLLGQDITNGATLVGSQDGETVTFTAPKVDALEITPNGVVQMV